MHDPRNNLANEVSAQLIEHFSDQVFRTIIPRNVRLAEAPSFGCPALYHDKESRGALAYLALAGEMGATLVTGNLRYFPPRIRRGTPVMNARQFLDAFYLEA